MAGGKQLHKQTTKVLSSLVALLGVGILIQTVVAGGGPLSKGVIIGVLFVIAGVGRFLVAGRVG